MKKILSVLLSLILVFGSITPMFAAIGGTAKDDPKLIYQQGKDLVVDLKTEPAKTTVCYQTIGYKATIAIAGISSKSI